MRLVPHYTVSYNGKFYRAGVGFDIADTDVAMMQNHGKVIFDNPPETGRLSQAESATSESGRPAKKAGRPKKQ